MQQPTNETAMTHMGKQVNHNSRVSDFLSADTWAQYVGPTAVEDGTETEESKIKHLAFHSSWVILWAEEQSKHCTRAEYTYILNTALQGISDNVTNLGQEPNNNKIH